jgi:hypothetical protein
VVRAIGSYHGEVHVGGDFGAICGAALTSPGWARYLVTGAPWIAYQPASQIAAPGSTVGFTAEPGAGYEGLSYRWYRDGVPLTDGGALTSGARAAAASAAASIVSGAATRTLTLQNVSVGDAADYTLVVSNVHGSETSSVAQLTVNPPAGVAPSTLPAARFDALHPNPTQGATTLVFTLASSARVRTRIHDVAGRAVRQHDAGRLAAGQHRLSWDGRGDRGARLGPGVYFVELEADGRPLGTRHLVIVR